MFLPSVKKYGHLSAMPEKDQLSAMKQQFKLLKEHAIAQGRRALMHVNSKFTSILPLSLFLSCLLFSFLS